jgi:hypothetical protein
MGRRFAEIAFTPAVRALQEAARGGRAGEPHPDGGGSPPDRLGPEEAGFIAARDGFFLASVSETGWPYVQHRGGPAGFLRVLDERTLGFADFRGNRQYVSLGNLARDDRVSLILMDHARRRRLKILGHARAVGAEEDPALLARLALPEYRARVDRGILISIEAFDWNCPQHITPRFTAAEVAEAVAPLRQRIAALEAALAAAQGGAAS